MSKIKCRFSIVTNPLFLSSQHLISACTDIHDGSKHLHGDLWTVEEECKTCICSIQQIHCSKPEIPCRLPKGTIETTPSTPTTQENNNDYYEWDFDEPEYDDDNNYTY